VEVSSHIPKQAKYVAGFVIVGLYVLAAVKGPQGLQSLMAKRQEIRLLQEQNAEKQAEVDRLRKRIDRLKQSSSEQEMEIRKQLKLVKPGETTFILPGSPTTDAPAPDAQAPADPQ
jgi:cell division protein FtsB